MTFKLTLGIRDGVTVLFVLLATTVPMGAQTRGDKPSADDLVRQTVSNELAAVNDGGHYRYRFEEETSKGSETRDMVETRDWLVGRVIFKNGKPLTAAEQEREDEKLRVLLKNPDRLDAFQKEEFSHRESMRKMIAAFPEAFICQYADTEQRGPYRGMIRVKFHPRPQYVPPSMELRPLQGMRGYAWIDPVSARLVRIDARFFRDVNFGWGILGSIQRGGGIMLEQRHVDGKRWAISELALHYNKRVLLMKTRVDSVTKTYEFRHLPDDVTLQKGLEELLDPNPMAVELRGDSVNPDGQ